ncbi:serine hydrolase domain-containing protein [Thalassotalea maritima]|uniref:serine hydrolase domain-containing protein n=1 Tax=Thalassotalea maritima TaxID=3242416 RepID=UPI003527E8CB
MTNLKIMQFLALFLPLINIAMAKENTSHSDHITLKELDIKIEAIARENNLPSIAYALIEKDTSPTIRIHGMANIELNLKANNETLYRIGSVSKMFSSLAILKLVEQQRLHLEDEVSTIVPSVKFYNKWEDNNPIRIVHLLEHTTGWDNLAFKEYARINSPEQNLSESLTFYPESRTSRWPPGTRYAYTNSGAAVAARIVEKISGQTFENFVTAEIFNPLNMVNSTYYQTEQVKTNGATSYINTIPQPYKHLIYRPAGAVNSTIEDMAKFTQFFVQKGEPILAQALLERMQRSESTNAGAIQTAQGLNNSARAYGPWVYYGHDGSVNGAFAELRYLPEANVGFVVLSNSNNQAAIKKVAKEIVNYQTQYLHAPRVNAKSIIHNKSSEVSGYYYKLNSDYEVAHFLNRLAATYKVTTKENNLTINGLLFYTTANLLLPASENSFKSAEHGLVELTIADDPVDGQVLHYKDKVLKRISSLALYSQFVFAMLWLLVIILTLLLLLINEIRRLLGRTFSKYVIRIRRWTCLASVSGFVFLASVFVGMQAPHTHLGNITIISVAMMLSTIAFAIFTLIAIFQSNKISIQSVPPVTYWFYKTSAIIHFIVACYFFYFGVIGMQVWT